MLLGTLIWAFAQVLAKPISKKIGGLALTAWLGVISGPLTIVTSFFIEGNTNNYITNADMKTWITVFYLGPYLEIPLWFLKVLYWKSYLTEKWNQLYFYLVLSLRDSNYF